MSLHRRANCFIMWYKVINPMEKMKLLPPDEQAYMERLFVRCPEMTEKNMTLRKVEKGRNFVTAGEPCRSIFLILKGRALGIDMQIPEKMYAFKEFGPGRFLGEFECLSAIPEYSITIRALTPCTLYVIPANLYLEWMKKDGNALFLRTQKILYDLTKQTRNDRKYLMLESMDRMILYLMESYEKEEVCSELCIRKTREELSGAIGFSEKTINRNAKKLEELGFLSLRTGKIYISVQQYESMKQYAQGKLY